MTKMNIFERQNKLIELDYMKMKRKYRMHEGVKQLYLNPVKLLFILIWAVAFITANHALKAFISYGITEPEMQILIPIVSYTVTVMVFGALLLSILLPWLGKPKRANEIEADLANVFDLPTLRLYTCPFLISIKPIQKNTSNALEYTFHSRRISIDKWQNLAIRESLRTLLDCQSIEDFRYGIKGIFRKRTNYSIIILSVVPNDGRQSREAPKDPLFKD